MSDPLPAEREERPQDTRQVERNINNFSTTTYYLLHTVHHTLLLQTPPHQGQHTPWQTRPSTSNSLNSWPSTLPANSSSRTSSTPSRRTSTARRACTSLARAQLCGGSTPTRSPLPPQQRPLAMHLLPPPCPWTIRTECSLYRAPPSSNSSSFSNSTAVELAAPSEVKWSTCRFFTVSSSFFFFYFYLS